MQGSLTRVWQVHPTCRTGPVLAPRRHMSHQASDGSNVSQAARQADTTQSLAQCHPTTARDTCGGVRTCRGVTHTAPTRQQLKQDRADAPQVRLRVILVVAQDLGGHVEWAAAERLRQALRVARGHTRETADPVSAKSDTHMSSSARGPSSGCVPSVQQDRCSHSRGQQCGHAIGLDGGPGSMSRRHTG